VDVSLYDVALHQLGYAGTWYLNSGEAASRLERSSHFSLAPVQTFPTADGWIFVMCMSEKFWSALLEVLGREELAGDPRFADGNTRHRYRKELTAILDPAFRQATTEQWLKRLSGVLPVGPVYDIGDALSSPFAKSSGMIQTVPHRDKEDLKLLASPIKVNGARSVLAPCAPLGADNEALLRSASTSRGSSDMKLAK
jgi:crotonobetainyl-CoA:carnitine CoA-transferase CaiB-like acyl-CoA transferase